MWKGAAETLNASPARIIASPAKRNVVVRGLAVGDLREAQLRRGAVDERRAEEKHGGAEPAHDEVLQPGFERRLALAVDGDQDVEAE